MKTRKINAKQRLLGASILCLAVCVQQLPATIDHTGQGFLNGTHDATGAPIPPATYSAKGADDIIKNELPDTDLHNVLVSKLATLKPIRVLDSGVNPALVLYQDIFNGKVSDEEAFKQNAKYFEGNNLSTLLDLFDPMIDRALNDAVKFTDADISPEAKKPCQENIFKAIQGEKVESVDKAALKAALMKRPVGESLEIMMPAQQKQAIADLTAITKLIAAVTDEERAKQIVANRLLLHKGIALDDLNAPTIYEERMTQVERLDTDISTKKEEVTRLTKDIHYINGIRTQAEEAYNALPKTERDNDDLFWIQDDDSWLGQTLADNIAAINAGGLLQGAETTRDILNDDAWDEDDKQSLLNALAKLTNEQVYDAINGDDGGLLRGGLLRHWKNDRANAHTHVPLACQELAKALDIDDEHVPAANTVDEEWNPTENPTLQKRLLIQLAADGINFCETLDAQRAQLAAKQDALKAVQDSIKGALGAVDAYANTPEFNVNEGHYNDCKNAIIAQYNAFQKLENYLEGNSPFLLNPVTIPTTDQVRQQFANAIKAVHDAHQAFERDALDKLGDWRTQLGEAQGNLADLNQQKRDAHVNPAHIGAHVSQAAWNTFEKLKPLLGDNLESFVKSGALTGNNEEHTAKLLIQHKAFAHQKAQQESNAEFAKDELGKEF